MGTTLPFTLYTSTLGYYLFCGHIKHLSLLNPSSEANSHSASQEIIRRVNNSLSLVPVLSQINPVRKFPTYSQPIP